MAHFLFNFSRADTAQGSARQRAAELMRARMWGVDADEQHRDALSAGDVALIYIAPDRVFIGSAEVASAAHDWTPAEAKMYPADSRSGLLLAQVEEWDPPVPLDAVVQRIDPTGPTRTSR